MRPYELTAAAASDLIARKELSCEELTRSCLERISDRDPVVRAWTHVDPEQAIRHARELDRQPPRSPLHGIPFGIKDVIDTADLPTTHNSPIYIGHRVGRDAACVAVVRHSGGVILGKTDTVEFACAGRRALTRNPHNLAHTPGGSSSGSAAAVADLMCPLAFGTQTGGSLIRPASYTGIYAFKPTAGLVSREGAKMYSQTLDTIGSYGRSIADLRLVAGVFRLPQADEATGFDPDRLRIGVCRTPYWDRAEAAGRDALEFATRQLERAGVEIRSVELADDFGKLARAHEIIMHGEGRAAFLPEYLGHYERLHQDFRDHVENAKMITPRMMADAYDLAARCRAEFDRLFATGVDAILTLATPGVAPEGYHFTGDIIFTAFWTLLHVPALCVPAGPGENGLPIGIQLIGPRFGDLALLDVGEAVAPLLDVSPARHPVSG